MDPRLLTPVVFVAAFASVLGAGFYMRGGAVSVGTIAATVGLLAIFVSIYLLFERTLQQVEIQRRYDAIEARDAAAKASRERDRRRARQRIEEIYETRRSLVDVLAGSVQRLFRIEGDRLAQLRLQLASAGFYRERALAGWLVATAASPVVGMGLGMAGAQAMGETGDGFLIYMASGAIGGFLLLRRWLNRRIAERRLNLYREMPDAIDLLVIYTDSGVAFDGALQKIVEQMRRRYPTTAEELSVLERELQVMPERVKAFENLVRRHDIPIVRAFCAILAQSERMGSPIGDSLRQLAQEARRDRLLDAERRAGKIPILIQIPVVLFILPALMLTVMGPAVVEIMRTFGFISPQFVLEGERRFRAEPGQAVERTLTIRNVGKAATMEPFSVAGAVPPGTTQIGQIRLEGDGWSFAGTTCGALLMTRQACEVTVRFVPPGGGPHPGELRVSDPNLSRPAVFRLEGVGG
jgi:tight adherence protein C